MLGKLLGLKPQKSALPKNQIEVICPVCGSVQREPRLVVTTMCRKCGEHLRIEKRKVIASSQINPVPSAIFPSVNQADPTSSAGEFNDSEPAPVPQPPSALLPEISDGEPVPLGLGNMIMGVQDESPQTQERHEIPDQESTSTIDEPEVIAPDVPEVSLEDGTTEPQSSAEAEPEPEPPSQPTPAPSLPLQRRSRIPIAPLRTPVKRPEPVRAPEPSTFQKMREQGIRQQHFKEIECFDCNHKFKVGRSARQTQCPACSSSICMEDIDINVSSTTPIRTRGDVYVRKMGNVNTSEIKCRDLHVQGIISARVECTGELTMRTAGTIVGEIHCLRLHVVKGSDIQLVNTIFAEEVEIYARICGNIHCNGPVLIGSGGCVEGDVTARSVNIEPGGHLDGAMNILRPAPKKAKPKNPDEEGEQPTLPL
ncbi:hypothetical protein FEM03_20610 [Phragmitibacter flavus]|uniref:Polymer-forming cytoskeletal protein n=1 Tax=Phragmitibacter flavus TaxID=2576071 RepID=A0A5R8K996_9BACT|nr:polymer-forming cytoskeletal protein [Phragmitibacter flavus]TLD68877.1 hypothetical protein FEM03_20610 [Phragmitibacter flavus]